MISHREAEALISARLDQPLDPIAERALSAHLATCAACRAFSQSSTALATGLRELPYLPPSSAVSRRVMARVDEGRSPWTKFGGILNTNPGPAFSTFAIIAVLFLLGFFVLNRFVLDDRGGPDSGDNQLASQPTAPPTQSASFVLESTPEPTQQITPTTAPVATEPPTATTAPTEVPPTEVPPTATDVPQPTATVPPPTATVAPTEPPTAAPQPTAPPTVAPTTPPTEESLILRGAASDATPSDIVDLTTPDSLAGEEGTATPYVEPESTVTSIPTEVPSPTVTATAVLDPTATLEPTEEEAPPIQPIDGGEIVQAPEDATSTAAVTQPSEETPASTSPANEDVPIQPIGTEGEPPASGGTDGQAIEPVGQGAAGATPGDDQQTQTVEVESPEVTETPAATGTSVPDGTIDLEANSDVYGDIAGERGGRLILDGGRMEYGAQAHPAVLTSEAGLKAEAVSGANGQGVGICVSGGECTDLSSASSEGAATDEPLGWIDGGVVYARTESNTVSYRYLVPDESGTDVISDDLLYDGAADLAPTFPVYQAEGRIWVITAGGDWMALTSSSAQRLANGYANAHDLRFANTGNQGLIVGYVSGGELIIAPGEQPGSPRLVLPFSGVDFDMAPTGDQIVVSTGTSIEIYGLDGTLVSTYVSEGVQPGTVLWLNPGIVYVDTATGVLMQISDTGR